jgi:hypothetical protein
VALEGSRELTEAKINKFYWIETLENHLRTDFESGEGTFLPGGDSSGTLRYQPREGAQPQASASTVYPLEKMLAYFYVAR